MKSTNINELECLLLNPRICNPSSRARKQFLGIIQEIDRCEAEILIDRVLDACSDTDRRLVCMRLATLNSSIVVVPLVHRLLGQESESVRIAAAFSLMEIGDLRAIDAMVQALSDPSARVVQLSCNALGWMISQVRDKLIALLSNPDAVLRLVAAENLLDIGVKHEKVLSTLEGLVSDTDIALIDSSIDLMGDGQKKLADLIECARKL